MNSQKKPKVAVLLAAYNGINWIEEQIITILNQKNVDITIYVSIDLSTDKTFQYIEEISKNNQNIILLPYGERFGGAAKNFFRLIIDVDFSNYDYISLSDQDDIWHENKIIKAISLIEKNNADAYSSNVIAFWENGRKSLIKKSQPQKKWDFLFEAAGPGCTYLLKTSLSNSIKKCLIENFDKAKNIGLHDWFVYAYARSKNFKWIIDPEPSMLYRQHSNNQVGVNQGFRAHAYRAKKILSGWGIEQSILISEVIGLKENSLPRKWKNLNKTDLLWLALNASKFRRRIRDQILFSISCIGMVTIGKIIEKK